MISSYFDLEFVNTLFVDLLIFLNKELANNDVHNGSLLNSSLDLIEFRTTASQ